MGDLSPIIMKARYPSRCPETGRWIQPGDRIVYAPRERRAYHWDSRLARTARQLTYERKTA